MKSGVSMLAQLLDSFRVSGKRSKFGACFQAAVDQSLQKLGPILRDRVVLTERELSLLAIAVTEMEQLGLDPYGFQYLVQVAVRLDQG